MLVAPGPQWWPLNGSLPVDQAHRIFRVLARHGPLDHDRMVFFGLWRSQIMAFHDPFSPWTNHHCLVRLRLLWSLTVSR